MFRTLPRAVAVVLLASAPAAAADYKIKPTKAAPPDELKAAVRKQIADGSVQLLDDKGGVVCEVWFVKELPAKATDAQVKNGLTFREVAETTLVGAVRLPQMYTDYRKQKIKPGVYTRGPPYQPQDGDHMGPAPHGEFCLLSPADEDATPGPLKDAKALHELSTKATGTSHPSVLLLYPEKAGAEPKLVMKKGEAG